VQRAAEIDRPRVFLSFAGSDRDSAMRFSQDLARAGIHTFVYDQSIRPAENFVLAINRALAQSDYYTLLLSRASVESWWVEQEWSAAFTREHEESRSFLFVARLDGTPLPPLLATRRYLDAFDDWDAVVKELAATWHEDWTRRGNGAHTQPSPPFAVGTAGAPCRTVALTVRNRDLSVGLVLAVPERWTGRELERRVRAELALPDDSKMSIGKMTVELRFHYRLEHGGKPISPDQPIVDQKITNGAEIDLVIRKEELPPGGHPRSTEFRGRRPSPSAIPPGIVEHLIDAALGHLLPLPPRERQ